MYNLSIIRVLCERKKIKMKDLAKQVGLTPQGLQDIIARNSTKETTLYKIAKALDVDISIFSEKGTDIVNDPVTEYIDYKQKYIQLLEEYNSLLKSELQKQDKRIKTNKC